MASLAYLGGMENLWSSKKNESSFPICTFILFNGIHHNPYLFDSSPRWKSYFDDYCLATISPTFSLEYLEASAETSIWTF